LFAKRHRLFSATVVAVVCFAAGVLAWRATHPGSQPSASARAISTGMLHSGDSDDWP